MRRASRTTSLSVLGAHLNADAEERLIDLRANGTSRDDELELELRAECSKKDLEALLGAYDRTEVAVVFGCRPTDSRHAVSLFPSDLESGLWAATHILDLRLYRGQIAVKAIVTGSAADGLPRILGESPSWKLLLDETAGPQLSGELPVKWVDFASQVQLKPFIDEPFHADLESPLPTIYLNSRIEGLSRVLPREGQPIGALRPVYETVRTSIARSVWMALFGASLAGIVRVDDADSEEPPEWPEAGWQEQVLRRVLPGVYPDASPEEALRLASNAQLSEQAARQLESRALLVIQRDILRDGRSLRRALRAVDDYILTEV